MNENGGLSGREPAGQWLVSLESISAISHVVSSICLTVVAIGFAISFLYNWGFFFALGITPDTVPASIQDYVNSWMTWLPATILVGFCFCAMELFEYRKKGSKGNHDPTSTSNDEQSRTKKSRRTFAFVAMAGIFLILMGLLFKGTTGLMYFGMGATLSWTVYVLWSKIGSRSKRRSWVLLRNLIISIPPLALAAFLYGFSQAESERYGQNGVYLIYMKNKGEESTKPLEVEIVRTPEKWMLIRSKCRQVAWIPLDRIDRFDLKKRRLLSL